MQKQKKNSILLEGDQSIADSGDLRQRLLDALAEHNSVVVEEGALTRIDTSSLQVLIAARRSAAAAGRTLRIAARPDGVLLRSAIRNGLLDPADPSASPDSLFRAGENQEPSGARA